MAGLLLPVGPRRMSSWTAHQQRSPKSTEPGTDFYCPIGTPVQAPASGTIYGWGDSITPATGRWVGVDLDNGQRFRCMHLNRIVRSSGRVRRGEVIGISGASGYGKPDWSGDPNTGGAHTHVTLWPTHQTRFGYDSSGKPYTIDFMKYADIGTGAGGGGTPFPPTPKQGEEDMELVIKAPNGTVVHFAPGVKHDFASQDEYGQIAADLENIRSKDGTDAMRLPPLNEVVAVSWDSYIRFCAYFNVPTAKAVPAPGAELAAIAKAVRAEFASDPLK